jgi:hypothetical protein
MYARVDTDDVLLQDVILPAARAHVLEYTGLTAEAADEMPQLAVACLALCAHMYDHRDMITDKPQLNQVIESILGSNSVNLL